MEIFNKYKNEKGDIVIARKYQILHKIGNGSFGEVYVAKSIQSSRNVALKVEQLREGHRRQLGNEYEMYLALGRGIGFPEVHGYRKERLFHCMAMELLGPSLTELQLRCNNNNRFSMKTVLMLADQMLERVNFIHRKGLLHRDLKPSNMLMGSTGRTSRLFLADFGMATRYIEEQTGVHIAAGQSAHLTGTARYASLNTLRRCVQSRRDDLEALGYVLVHLAKGRLPWQGIKAATQAEMLSKVLMKKQSVLLDDLCQGLPEVFLDFLHYSRGLKFAEKPNYDHLRELFRKEFREGGYICDFDYDWLKLDRDQQRKEQVKPKKLKRAK